MLHRLHPLVKIQRRVGMYGTHGLVNTDLDTRIFVTGTQTVKDKIMHLRQQAIGLDT